jgi:hypothetical protein
MELKKFNENFVLVNDNKFEIGFDEKINKLYMKVGYCNERIYFNVIEEKKDIYYAVFEETEIEVATKEDEDINFDFNHNKKTCDWFEDKCYSDIFKFENKEKKLIIFNKCDDCGEILFENSDIFYCCECGTVACDNCFYKDWNTCDYCQSDYCNSCDDLDYSELLEKTFCDSDECISNKEEEEEEQEQEQEEY